MSDATQSLEEFDADHGRLQRELDELSLRQALVDVEVANSRVLDLTQRLVEAAAANAELRNQLEGLRIEHAQLRSIHEQTRASQAFKLAERIWAVRNALGI